MRTRILHEGVRSNLVFGIPLPDEFLFVLLLMGLPSALLVWPLFATAGRKSLWLPLFVLLHLAGTFLACGLLKGWIATGEMPVMTG